MYAHEALTPDEKAELHRWRFELGQEMARRLARRTLGEQHDTLYGRESFDIDGMRRIIWRAEYDALRFDPYEEHLPEDIRQTRPKPSAE